MTTRVFSSDSSRTAVMSVMTLVLTKFGDTLDEHGAVNRVRNFRDDDLFAPALLFLDEGLAADFEGAAAGGGVGLDAREARAGCSPWGNRAP